MSNDGIFSRQKNQRLFPFNFHLVFCNLVFVSIHNSASNFLPHLNATIASTMTGGKRSHAVEKIYQNHIEQNVQGRKKVQGSDYVIRNTPKRLQDGFTRKLDSNKKKSTSTSTTQHGTRSSTAAEAASKLASSRKSVLEGKTPFAPTKKRGRKKKPTSAIQSTQVESNHGPSANSTGATATVGDDAAVSVANLNFNNGSPHTSQAPSCRSCGDC